MKPGTGLAGQQTPTPPCTGALARAARRSCQMCETSARAAFPARLSRRSRNRATLLPSAGLGRPCPNTPLQKAPSGADSRACHVSVTGPTWRDPELKGPRQGDPESEELKSKVNHHPLQNSSFSPTEKVTSRCFPTSRDMTPLPVAQSNFPLSGEPYFPTAPATA